VDQPASAAFSRTVTTIGEMGTKRIPAEVDQVIAGRPSHDSPNLTEPLEDGRKPATTLVAAPKNHKEGRIPFAERVMQGWPHCRVG